MPQKTNSSAAKASRGFRALGPGASLKKSVLAAIFVVAATIGVYAVNNAFAAGGGNPEIVDQAKKRLGLVETGNNSGGKQKINGKWVYTGEVSKINQNHSGRDGQWCAYFVSYVYKKAGTSIGTVPGVAGLDDAIKKNGGKAYTNTSTNRKNNTPQAGDAIWFGSTHAGVVEKVTCNKDKSKCTVHTIEGNSSNGVNRRSYSLSNPKITGWGGIHKNGTASGSLKQAGKSKSGSTDKPKSGSTTGKSGSGTQTTKPKSDSTPKCSTAYECAGGGGGKTVIIN